MSTLECGKKIVTFGNHSLLQSDILKICFNSCILNIVYQYNRKYYEKLYKAQLKKIKKNINKKKGGKHLNKNNLDTEEFNVLKDIEKLKNNLGENVLEDKLLDTYALKKSNYLHIELYEPNHNRTTNPEYGLFANDKGFYRIFLPKDTFYYDNLSKTFEMYVISFLSDKPDDLKKKIYSKYNDGIFLWNKKIEEDIIMKLEEYKEEWIRIRKSRIKKIQDKSYKKKKKSNNNNNKS